MILKALYDLAVSRGTEIREDPDFTMRPVHFVIRFDAQGRYLGVESLLDDKGKPRSYSSPRVPERTVAVLPAFLTDNAQYTLRLSKENAKGDRGARCAEAFDALVAQAARDTRDEALVALERLLARRDQWADQALRAAEEQLPRARDGSVKWDGKDVFTFAFSGDSGWVQDRAAARDWWKLRRQSSVLGDTSARLALCLVTEQMAPIHDLHVGIRGVPNTGMTGAKIASFNSEAFVSWGYDTNDGGNAPTSREGAEGYAAALNWLLARTPARAHRQGVKLGPESVVVFWTREPSDAIEMLLSLDAPSADEMRAMLLSPWKGTEREVADATQFYALTLGGNRSRIVVRDWFTSTAGQVKANLRAYFDDLRIASLVDEAEVPVPILWLLSVLQARPRSQQDRGDLPPDLSAQLFHAAVHGTLFPLMLVAKALARLRLPPDRDAYVPGGALTALRLRCALIKATLNRHNRSNPGWRKLTVSLDESNRDVPYVLGRLFAVMESAQADSVGRDRDINATLRDRYFGAASSSPATVFPTLMRLFGHHVAKIRKEGSARRDGQGSRLPVWRDLETEQILDLLPAVGAYPMRLSLEQQGVFALGYYHQRADTRRRIAERIAASKARKEAAAVTEPTAEPA